MQAGSSKRGTQPRSEAFSSPVNFTGGLSAGKQEAEPAPAVPRFAGLPG
jgi:hypothetical protein